MPLTSSGCAPRIPKLVLEGSHLVTMVKVFDPHLLQSVEEIAQPFDVAGNIGELPDLQPKFPGSLGHPALEGSSRMSSCQLVCHVSSRSIEQLPVNESAPPSGRVL